MNSPAIWFPTVRTNTGTDVFVQRLVAGLCSRGIHAEITWLPLRAEYAPFTVRQPSPPTWANTIHTNSWLYSGFLPPHIPTVVTVHHTIHRPELQKHKGLLRALYHRYWIAPNERRMLVRADRITAVSQFVANATKTDLVDRPIEIIHNGIDINGFCPREKAQNKPFRLLYVGSWSSRKGVDLLQPIMGKLGADFELVYIGPEAEKLHENAHSIGVMLGENQVVEAMQNADALLFPSRSEGFGLVVVEAMACGLPVITTRIPPLTEIVQDGVNGLLCQTDDIEGFARAARTLKDDPMLYNAISDAARKRAVATFSMDAMINKYLKIYKDLVLKNPQNEANRDRTG